MEDLSPMRQNLALFVFAQCFAHFNIPPFGTVKKRYHDINQHRLYLQCSSIIKWPSVMTGTIFVAIVEFLLHWDKFVSLALCFKGVEHSLLHIRSFSPQRLVPSYLSKWQPIHAIHMSTSTLCNKLNRHAGVVKSFDVLCSRQRAKCQNIAIF